MLHCNSTQYMFFDFAKGGVLKETGIPLHADKNGILNLKMRMKSKRFLKNSSQTWKFTLSGQLRRFSLPPILDLKLN